MEPERKELLEEVVHHPSLKHVDSNDKSAPVIDPGPHRRRYPVSFVG